MNELSAAPLGVSLLGACPEVLLFGAALFLAVARWNRHPRVSMYVAAGAVTMIVTTLFSRVLLTALSMSRPAEAFATMVPVISVVSGVLHMVGIGLLLAAAFVDRAR